MRRLGYLLLAIIMLVACNQSKADLGLGVYNDRVYENEHFKLKFEVPKDFAFLTADELQIVNEKFQAEHADNEDSKYRNKVIDISHVDGTKLVAYVDAHPKEYKHALREANDFLDFLTAERVNYSVDRSEVEINGVTYYKLELDFDFNESQVNYITVRNNKLINIQINYHQDNVESAKQLVNLYEQ